MRVRIETFLEVETLHCIQAVCSGIGPVTGGAEHAWKRINQIGYQEYVPSEARRPLIDLSITTDVLATRRRQSVVRRTRALCRTQLFHYWPTPRAPQQIDTRGKQWANDSMNDTLTPRLGATCTLPSGCQKSHDVKQGRE